MKIERILLATDCSNWAKRAGDYAHALAASWQAHLTIMTVLEFPPGLNPDYPVNQQYLADRMREASDQLSEFRRRVSHTGLEISTRIATGVPSQEITAAAKGEGSGLVVLGTRGKSGLAHVLLGSTAERVIRTAPCPVLAVHAEEASSSGEEGIRVERILVPVDFSDCSLDALEYAAIVAGRARASIQLLHVLEPVSYGLDFALVHAEERKRQHERLTKRLQDLSEALSASGINVTARLRGGVPVDSILDELSKSGADMIVMGTHGRRGLSHMMAGSVAESILRLTQCPVLTVRSPKFTPGHRRVTSVAAAEPTNP
jgi:nucleotide-binding universal stress UspA family protein